MPPCPKPAPRWSLMSCLLLIGCSTLPDRDWPQFDQRQVTVFYSPDGSPIEVPVSGENLTVLSLEVDPPPASERWEHGRHLVLPAPGAAIVKITCRYRAYARDGKVATPAELFPGATVRDLRP